MEYHRLDSTCLNVSDIVLGGGNLGKCVDEAASARVIDDALSRGVNFIDPADWYGADLGPKKGHHCLC